MRKNIVSAHKDNNSAEAKNSASEEGVPAEGAEVVAARKCPNKLDALFAELDLDSGEKTLAFNAKKLIIGILTAAIWCISITAVALLQNDMIDEYQANATVSVEENRKVCYWINLFSFNVISTPLALCLIALYMLLFWRRSCCLTCFYRRPAPPMIIHPFKKHGRFMPACVYGIMAHQVMDIVTGAIFKSGLSDELGSEVPGDPTGLFKLLMRIVQVLTVAVRYYPPLVAFSANSFLVYVTSALYMLVDLANNIYDEGNRMHVFVFFYDQPGLLTPS
jgi:hypothetical protein